MELKKRRAAGEVNLMIKRGSITSSNIQKLLVSSDLKQRKHPVKNRYSDISMVKEVTDEGAESEETLASLASNRSSSSSSD